MRDDARQHSHDLASVPLAAVPIIEPPVQARTYRQLFDRETLADYLRLSTDAIDRLVKSKKLRASGSATTSASRSVMSRRFSIAAARIGRSRHEPPGTGHPRVAVSRRQAGGLARVRQPIKDKQSALWRARYVDLEGAVRQLGVFKTKGQATAETAALVAELNGSGPGSATVPTLL